MCTFAHRSALSSCFSTSVKGARRVQWGCMSGAAMRLPAQLRPLISLKEKKKKTTPVSQCHRDQGNDPKSQATVAQWLEFVCSVCSKRKTQAFWCLSSLMRTQVIDFYTPKRLEEVSYLLSREIRKKRCSQVCRNWGNVTSAATIGKSTTKATYSLFFTSTKSQIQRANRDFIC